jgi:hypothetical protein
VQQIFNAIFSRFSCAVFAVFFLSDVSMAQENSSSADRIARLWTQVISVAIIQSQIVKDESCRNKKPETFNFDEIFDAFPGVAGNAAQKDELAKLLNEGVDGFAKTKFPNSEKSYAEVMYAQFKDVVIRANGEFADLGVKVDYCKELNLLARSMFQRAQDNVRLLNQNVWKR